MKIKSQFLGCSNDLLHPRRSLNAIVDANRLSSTFIRCTATLIEVTAKQLSRIEVAFAVKVKHQKPLQLQFNKPIRLPIHVPAHHKRRHVSFFCSSHPAADPDPANNNLLVMLGRRTAK